MMRGPKEWKDCPTYSELEILLEEAEATIKQLQALNVSLIERVAAQSDLLTRKAERPQAMERSVTP